MRTKQSILVFDNDPGRVYKLRAWLPEERDHQVMLKELPIANLGVEFLGQAWGWDGVILDYDLDSSDTSINPFNGLAVAKVIIEMLPKDVPLLLYSMNAQGRQQMAELLRGAGFPVTEIPFDELDESSFRHWVECPEGGQVP